MKQIETTEDISSEMQIAVDADAQFSMFGGSDKFRFSNSSVVHKYHPYWSCLYCQASRQIRRNEQYSEKSGDRAVMIWRAEPDGSK